MLPWDRKAAYAYKTHQPAFNKSFLRMEWNGKLYWDYLLLLSYTAPSSPLALYKVGDTKTGNVDRSKQKVANDRCKQLENIFSNTITQ